MNQKAFSALRGFSLLAASGALCLTAATAAAGDDDGALRMTKSVATTAADSAGGEITYRIDVTNTSTVTAKDVHVADSLRDVLDDAELIQQPKATSGVVGKSDMGITWDGDVQAGKTARITYVLAPKPNKGVYKNDATATWGDTTSGVCSSTYDPSAGNDATGNANTSCSVDVPPPAQVALPPREANANDPATQPSNDTPADSSSTNPSTDSATKPSQPQANCQQSGSGSAQQAGHQEPCVGAPHAGAGGAAAELTRVEPLAADASTGSEGVATRRAGAALAVSGSLIIASVFGLKFARRRRAGDA
ncbi:DUF7507 domain-containing protein [Streptomyces fractus]|uniref:DUF7927 domain-containing protein n=1 Tax=Streptomyces fractus TaxID=641806 RepID=UPI003CFB7C34